MRKVINFLKQVLSSRLGYRPPNQPVIIPRSSHKISRARISKSALKVLYRLHKSGYSAYLVGGGVRDLLLGHAPKDFDVATNAHPEQVHRLFRNSYVIGRRFRLVHINFGNEIVEVATFRGNTKNSSGRIQTQQGLLLRDNVYGTLEDDVWRRDFTVNALYYNIADFSVVDYAKGMEDLKSKHIRVIGDPIARYREDPVRMLRALRLAAKLDFQIDHSSAEPIKKYRELLTQIPPARLFDKMLKIFHSGKSFATFQLLHEYEVLPILFPQPAAYLEEQKCSNFLDAALKDTDKRVKSKKSINSSFLFAVLLWCPMQGQKMKILRDNPAYNEHQAMHLAMSEVITRQLQLISIPRKFITVMREIWYLQPQLEQARARRVYKILQHPCFRAAYDFLVLRYQTCDSSLEELVNWWHHFQAANDDEAREELIASRNNKTKRRRKRRRGKHDHSVSGIGQ